LLACFFCAWICFILGLIISFVADYAYKAIDALPVSAHPMTQFTTGVMALQVEQQILSWSLNLYSFLSVLFSCDFSSVIKLVSQSDLFANTLITSRLSKEFYKLRFIRMTMDQF